MADKRIRKRRHLSCLLRVFDRNTGDAVGHLVDITTEGIRLLTDNPLKTGADYELNLDLSSIMNFEQRVVFDAHCIWQEQEFSSGSYNYGFKILKISKKGREIIEQLIEQFGD